MDLVANFISDFEKNSNLDRSEILYLIDNYLPYRNMAYEFNLDEEKIKSKYNLFSPQFFHLIKGYKSFIEWGGGFGFITKVVKSLHDDMECSFFIKDIDILKFIRYKLDIDVIYEINKKYDVIVSDGLLHYLDEDSQIEVLNQMITYLNKGGIICLMFDINQVDVCKIHSILENSEMICIYGKNTFSSIWMRMY